VGEIFRTEPARKPSVKSVGHNAPSHCVVASPDPSCASQPGGPGR
jgi:hypothetical protein